MKNLLPRREAKGKFRDCRLLEKKPSSVAYTLKIILPYKEAKKKFFEKTSNLLFNYKKIEIHKHDCLSLAFWFYCPSFSHSDIY